MKSSSSFKHESNSDESFNGDLYLNPNYLRKSIDDLTISISNYNFSEIDKEKLIKSDEIFAPDKKASNVLGIQFNLTSDSISKSKSLNTISTIDKAVKDRETSSLNQSYSLSKDNKSDTIFNKLCGYEGGGGSGGCILSGPYEPMIIAKDDFSDESFESTEESDANIDFIGPVGITHNYFQNTEVVWAKRPGLPWFPGIIIDPNNIDKEIKNLMKQLGASSPHRDQLRDYSLALINSRQTDILFFIFLFNRKKTWLWLPESKLRPFCKENDKIFMENSPLLSTRYKKELEKAYKKAKKFTKSGGGPVIPSSTFYKAKHANDKN